MTTPAMARAFALLPILACAGCFAAAPHGGSDLDMLALSGPTTQESAPAPSKHGAEQATAILPPEAATVAGVSRRSSDGGFSERIRLTTDTRKPESHIDLAVRPADRTPSDAAIRAELTREFPDVPMQIAPTGAYQNAYGEFGLAIGRSGDALRCIYVWQYIDDVRQGGQSGRAATPASMRMKLCRTDMTVDQLADAASRIEITLPANVETHKRSVAAVPSATVDPRPAERIVEAPARRVAAQPSEPIVKASAPEGQRFLSASVAPTYAAASAVAPQTAKATVAGGSDLPPQAFAGPPPH